MPTFNDSKLSDSGLKLIKNLGIIACLVLLSFIPNCSTQRLVEERIRYEHEAIQSVITGWASAQSFGESSIFIPTTEKDGYDPKSKIY
ncbi:MAG: inner membrane CreD family protein, partial [Bdellovibrionaceae bacterium]|nr:inner membrane CreD family protein [Pseudobdellovibrionaceae bacterium]